MSILLSEEILESIKNELQNAENSVQIITAYCKENIIAYLDKYINTNINNKRLLVRFRMNDIVAGSTDFTILEYCLKKGWKVYIRFDLHAKTYIVDNKRCIISSANATNSGLNMGKMSNTEVGTLVELEPDDIVKIDNLFDNAIPVDDNILQNLKKQIKNIIVKKETTIYHWDNTITDLFNPKIVTLFSHELPESTQFKKGEYIPFLDVTYYGNNGILREKLRWSNAYLWLINVLKENDNEMFFGELSAKLHNIMVSDPMPLRKDIKIMLSNLLNIIEILQMKELIIDKPHYSQRIRLK